MATTDGIRGSIERLATQYSAATMETTETEQATVRWSGIICMEGQATGDGRVIEEGALTWDVSPESPIALRFVQEDVGAHDGAQVVGRIDNIERRDDGEIWAEGDFDLGSEIGRESRRHVEEKLTRGVSVDLDDVAFELRVASEVFDEAMLLSEDEEAEEVEPEVDEDGRVVVVAVNPDDEVMVTTSARIRAATLVATPAFADAIIRIDSSTEPSEDSSEELAQMPPDPTVADNLTAGAAPTKPPLSWFSNPKLREPTPIQVDDKGRIYGHVATWDVCHISNPYGTNECVMAPHSATDYAYFHTGSVQTKENEILSTGRISMNTSHAKPNARHTAASDHYDHTGTAVADVRAGEDSIGVWIAGSLRPGVTAAQVRTLRASPLSGDWRQIGGNLEMVAALAVNVPGFPVPRPKGLVASGALTSIQAAGMLSPKDVKEQTDAGGGGFSKEDIEYLKRLAQRGRESEGKEMARRVASAKSSLNRRKVEAFRAKKEK